jgi:hypothetical protein
VIGGGQILHPKRKKEVIMQEELGLQIWWQQIRKSIDSFSFYSASD